MAQLFHPAANVLANVSIVGGGLLTVGLIVAGVAVSRSPWNTKVGIPLDQPIPFSHEHHSVELGIDCRYCHTNVEKTAWAQVPPTETCMTCHSQIWTNSPLLEPVRTSYKTLTPIKGGWNQVNAVPDFVYFNHSIHVNRGINCNTCHGPIQKEALTAKGRPFFMAWCLNCHRSPEAYVNDRKEVFALYAKYQTGEKLTEEERTILDGEDYRRSPGELALGVKRVRDYKVQKKQLTDCWTCHR
jgi:hypothetical protein